MTIVDSLKAKGSTGGNNIAEAIKNLPMGVESNIYMVPGDYADGDTIDSESMDIYWKLLNDVGGMVLITIYVNAIRRFELFAYANAFQYCITNPQISVPTIGEDGTISFE